MLSFASDYIAGAHPAVLKKLMDTNLENLSGYGTDKYCVSAAEKIKAACVCPEAQVFFLVGGTQTNQIIIDTMLDSHEGVVAAHTGHVSVHEAGAIEYSGHKVLELPGKEGKIDSSALEQYLSSFFNDENHDHMVFPGMVYISYPTEFGTLYSKEELKSIYHACKQFKLPLYIDGARLGYGLAADECDLDLQTLTGFCDVFYIGGTKVGALCGEAVVFTHKNAPKCFVTKIKQHGALLAKGRLLGIQFDALFTDDLYFEISKHAIRMAKELKTILQRKKIPFFLESPTNQQFIIMPNKVLEQLKNEVDYSFWEAYDKDSSVIRFATSWSTTEQDLKELEQILDRYVS